MVVVIHSNDTIRLLPKGIKSDVVVRLYQAFSGPKVKLYGSWLPSKYIASQPNGCVKWDCMSNARVLCWCTRDLLTSAVQTTHNVRKYLLGRIHSMGLWTWPQTFGGGKPYSYRDDPNPVHLYDSAFHPRTIHGGGTIEACKYVTASRNTDEGDKPIFAEPTTSIEKSSHIKKRIVNGAHTWSFIRNHDDLNLLSNDGHGGYDNNPYYEGREEDHDFGNVMRKIEYSRSYLVEYSSALGDGKAVVDDTCIHALGLLDSIGLANINVRFVYSLPKTHFTKDLVKTLLYTDNSVAHTIATIIRIHKTLRPDIVNLRTVYLKGIGEFFVNNYAFDAKAAPLVIKDLYDHFLKYCTMNMRHTMCVLVNACDFAQALVLFGLQVDRGLFEWEAKHLKPRDCLDKLVSFQEVDSEAWTNTSFLTRHKRNLQLRSEDLLPVAMTGAWNFSAST